MSFPFVTPQPIDELDPDSEFALAERDRVVYEVRRFYKKHMARYMFWHQAPPGTCGLVVRDPVNHQFLLDRLKEMGFEKVDGSTFTLYRDFRAPSGNSIRVLIRLVNNEEPHPSPGIVPLPGPLLLVTTHTIL